MKKSEFEAKEFPQRIDFYWQYLTVYFIVMLIYGALRGSFEEGYITIKWKDPVMGMFLFFMLLSSVFLIYNYLKKKSILISNESIIFKTRTKKREYKLEEIIRISIGKYKRGNVTTLYKIVKIKVKNRKYSIKFRPNSYSEDDLLVKYINNLKILVENRNKNLDLKYDLINHKLNERK